MSVAVSLVTGLCHLEMVTDEGIDSAPSASPPMLCQLRAFWRTNANLAPRAPALELVELPVVVVVVEVAAHELLAC